MITYNIQANLSVWTNHTFSAGERCSDAAGSNAYQCTTPGPSTVAPSGTGSAINNGGIAVFKWLSPIDFTSTTTWNNALLTTFSSGLTDNVTTWVWNNGVFSVPVAFTSIMSIFSCPNNGFTLLFAAAPGESFRDKGPTNALAWNASNGVAFDIAAGTEAGNQFIYSDNQMNNLTFRGLQFRDTNAPGSNPETMAQPQGNNIIFEDCIFDGYWHVQFIGNNCGLINCLFDNRCTTPLPAAFPIKWDTASTGAYLVNCTIISASSAAGPMVAGLNSTPATAIARNCAFFGNSQPIVSQNVADQWSIDHCCFDGTSAQLISSPVNGFPQTDGGGNLFSKVASNQFVNTSTDFRLKAGSDCINAGVTDTTDIPTADDIFGTHRPQGTAWDIGAQEFVSGTSTALLPGAGALAARLTRTSSAAASLHGSGGQLAAAVKASLLISSTLGGASSIGSQTTGSGDPFSVDFSSAFGGTGSTFTLGAQLTLLAAIQSVLSGSGGLAETPIVIGHIVQSTLSGLGGIGAAARLFEAAASIFVGSGVLTAAPRGLSPAAAELMGAGDIAVQAIAQLIGASGLVGAGSLFARVPQAFGANAALGGTGNLVPALRANLIATAALGSGPFSSDFSPSFSSGNGSLIAIPLPLYWLQGTLAGHGGLTASPSLSGVAASTLAGIGGLLAAAGQANQQFTVAVLLGSGALLVAETSVLLEATALVGVGKVAATFGAGTLAVDAILGGAGSLLAPLALTAFASIALGGVGAATSFVSRSMPVTTVLAGTASMAAIDRLLVAVSTTFAGAGIAVTTAPIARMSAGVTLAGAGLMTIAPGQSVPASALMRGTGGQGASAVLFANALVLFGGAGALVAIAHLAFGAVSFLSGAGVLRIQESSSLDATAALVGNGAIVANDPTEVTSNLNGSGSLITGEFVIGQHAGIGAFAAQLQRGVYATDDTQNEERTPVFGVVTTAQPKRVGDLRAGTEDSRFYDLGDDLGPLGDWVLTASVTVARRDGATLVQPPDLVITPAGFRPPWLSAAEDYPLLALTVNWWEGADPTNPGADYIVTVQVTTQQGRVLEYDAYQMVVESTG